MQYIKSLGVGDRFRVAHPRQSSLNGRSVERTLVLKVTKVFPMSPYMTIAVPLSGQKSVKDFYSFLPETVVLAPKEPNPKDDEIIRFVSSVSRYRVLAYRLLWDGATDQSLVVTGQSKAVLQLLYATGKVEFAHREMRGIFTYENFAKFWNRPLTMSPMSIWMFERRQLVEKGLIEEITDTRSAPDDVRSANLQEIWHESK